MREVDLKQFEQDVRWVIREARISREQEPRLYTMKSVSRGAGGLMAETEEGAVVHLCFSDEVPLFLDSLMESHPFEVTRWLQDRSD